MNEEKPKDQSVELFLHADKKIEKIVSDVTELMKKDMGLDHKMDLVIQSQSQLKTGFDHSRETGHKTWEAMQKVLTAVERLTLEKEAQDKKIENETKALDQKIDGAINLSEKVDKRFDRMFYGIFAVVFLSVFAGVMSFLWNYRAGHP